MQLLLLLLSQLLSYGALGWAAFLSVAFCAARFGGLPGLFAGQVVIAALVTVLDVRWVTTALSVPGWDGSPDLDFVFVVGWIIRVLLINTFLLAVSIPALRLWQRHRATRTHPNIV